MNKMQETILFWGLFYIIGYITGLLLLMLEKYQQLTMAVIFFIGLSLVFIVIYISFGDEKKEVVFNDKKINWKARLK